MNDLDDDDTGGRDERAWELVVSFDESPSVDPGILLALLHSIVANRRDARADRLRAEPRRGILREGNVAGGQVIPDRREVSLPGLDAREPPPAFSLRDQQAEPPKPTEAYNACASAE